MTDASFLAEEIMPDTGPDPEWYRELADEDAVPRRAPDGRGRAPGGVR